MFEFRCEKNFIPRKKIFFGRERFLVPRKSGTIISEDYYFRKSIITFRAQESFSSDTDAAAGAAAGAAATAAASAAAKVATTAKAVVKTVAAAEAAAAAASAAAPAAAASVSE